MDSGGNTQGATWRDYLELTKPRVVALMILTALIGMCMAVPGFVPWQPLVLGNLGIALCAGAAAATLEGAGSDGERIVRPGELMKLDELPDELLVVGVGAAGAELVDALSRMGGIQITWVAGPFGLLPRFDRELAEAVGDVLMERGVKIVHGKRVDRIERLDDRAEVTLDGGHRYWAPLAVLALGSEPRLERLQLDRAGIEQLRVDERCRVSDRLLAAGECTGRATSAAAAEAMGRCAGRVAAGSAEARYRPERVPLVARTTPTIAQVGSTPEQVAGREVIFYTLRLEETLHGLLEGVGENDAAKGLIRVVCDSDNGALLGATAIGPSAVEAVSGVALALELGADDSRLSEVFAATPSRVDALVRATR